VERKVLVGATQTDTEVFLNVRMARLAALRRCRSAQ
jgi:hypothetical protein